MYLLFIILRIKRPVKMVRILGTREILVMDLVAVQLPPQLIW